MGVKGFEAESPIPETYFGPEERRPWWDPREVDTAVFLDHDLMGAEALDAGGINWTVSKRPLFYPDVTNDQPRGGTPTWGPAQHRAGRWMATVRDTDNAYLGNVMPGYRPFQQHELVKITDGILGEGGAYYHTAGSLYGGKLVWLLAKFDKGIHVKGDGSPIEDYFAIVNGHDGRHGCTAMTSMTRIWCGNTCAQAIEGAQAKVTLRHTSGMDPERVAEEIGRVLNIHVQYRETLETVLNDLADRPMTIDEVRAFTVALIPKDPKGEEASRSVKARRDLIADLFAKSPTLDAVPLTAYRAYQAVAEAADQYTPYRNTKLQRGVDRRALAVIEGPAYDLKGDAIRLLQKA